MTFNSFGFLFLFLPAFVFLYHRVPKRYRLPLLCLGSLLFYAVGVRARFWQFGLLLLMTLFCVAGCLLLAGRPRHGRAFLALWIAVIAAPLVWVKLAALFGLPSPPLPLGLSFYTFQMIAFLVHAARSGQCSAAETAAGILLFPKLLSGPIARPAELLPQLGERRCDSAMLESGLQEFVIGLAYKVILADHLGGLLGQVRTFGAAGVSVPMAWLGMIGYTLQLYFDFMGYSRMAVGVGRMIGLELPENFRHPYCSKSVREFWRRWHITLGIWFKEHVYIPLGGSRRGTARMVFSTFVVWLLTGIWHGAGWNFVCWGMMMFLLIMGERLLYGKWLDRSRVLCHVYLPLLIALSWVFFFTPSIAEACAYFLRLFGASAPGGEAGDWIRALRWCWPYLSLGILCSTPLPERLWKKVSGRAAAWPILFALFWVCAYFMATAAGDPFLYFSF